MAATSDLPADSLTLVVDRLDGTQVRWGPQEPEGWKIPQGLSFSTGTPGGFTDLTCELLRRIDIDQDDENLLGDVTVYGPGAEIVWQGRFKEFPRQTGHGNTTTPGAEGWVAHLRDDASFRDIYVDRDLTRWQGPGVAESLALTAAAFSPVAATIVPDLSAASLKTGISDTWVVGARPMCEPFYDAQAIPIGSLYYAWKRDTTTVDNADANWAWQALLSTNDTNTAFDTTGSLRAAGPGTGTLTATTSTKLFAVLQFYYGTSGGIAGTDYAIYWTCLAIYGNHGLTKRGSESATAAKGFYASDVIPHVLSNAAPLLNYTTGTDGTIVNTSTVLEQLCFLDPTTAEEAVKKVNNVHLFDWGVWENRTFSFKAPDDSDPWQVRIGDGVYFKADGPTGDETFNGVVVKYTDPAGQTRYVGPTGATKVHATDASLLDASATNPVNKAGIPKKWALLELSDPNTLAGATAVGAVFLLDRAQPQRRGELEITGFVTHPVKGKRPAWAVRAMDYITITDTTNTDISTPRRIIATKYDHDSRKLTATLDNNAHTLESLLELINASLVGVVTS